MSEFKFACPVCGQHITADSGSTGSQLECPTCYRKIVVPQAPTSADPKFILSAAEANKPRPPQPSRPVLEPIAQQPARTAIPVVVIVILILLCLLAASAFVFRGKMFGPKKPDAAQTGGANTGDTNEDGAPAVSKGPPVPVVTNDVAWTLDLSTNSIPDAPTAGKIRGEFVACNRNSLQPVPLEGKPHLGLSLRQTTRGLPDLSVTIYFFGRQAEDLAGKTINIGTNDTPAPRVTIRWKEGKDVRSQIIADGYALKAEFGPIEGNRLAGKIYLCLPDENQTRISGTFSAEIKKAAAPKPKPPKPKPAS